MSFGAIVPCLEGPCLFATGVLSLSSSLDLEGVTGTFNGCAECLDICQCHWQYVGVDHLIQLRSGL